LTKVGYSRNSIVLELRNEHISDPIKAILVRRKPIHHRLKRPLHFNEQVFGELLLRFGQFKLLQQHLLEAFGEIEEQLTPPDLASRETRRFA